MSNDREHKLTELGTTKSGLQPNVAAALAYVLTVLTGAIILVIEKENKYVRFHAVQAILYGVVWMILWAILGIAVTKIWFVPVIGLIINDAAYFVVVLGGFVLWLFLVYKAYKRERFKLPILGDIAEKIA